MARASGGQESGWCLEGGQEGALRVRKAGRKMRFLRLLREVWPLRFSNRVKFLRYLRKVKLLRFLNMVKLLGLLMELEPCTFEALRWPGKVESWISERSGSFRRWSSGAFSGAPGSRGASRSCMVGLG